MTQDVLISSLVQSIWDDLSENVGVGNHVWEWDRRGIKPSGWYWITKWEEYYQHGEEDLLDEAFMHEDLFKWKQSLKEKEEKRNPFWGKSYKDEIKGMRLDMWDVIEENPFIVELMALIKKYEPEFYVDEDLEEVEEKEDGKASVSEYKKRFDKIMKEVERDSND